MKESKLLPILRSQTQGDLLARLFLNPGREYTLSELSRLIGASLPGVHHECVRLIEAGYLSERREGRNRLVTANTGMDLYESLTSILALTYGPLPLLEEALRGIDGIERAFIYGSWAKRYSGLSGGVPRDIDLGIVGSIKTDDIYEDILEIEVRLAREVNFVIFSIPDWKSGSPLIREIQGTPIVEIDLK